MTTETTLDGYQETLDERLERLEALDAFAEAMRERLATKNVPRNETLIWTAKQFLDQRELLRVAKEVD